MTQTVTEFLDRGGPALWLIALLSVVTLALILWKIWQLSVLGAWRRKAAEQAIAQWCDNSRAPAIASLRGRGGMRSRVARAAMQALCDRPIEAAREETARMARGALMEARDGLRALELIATIAPLIGLLGTVLGMIDAFQTLQEAGGQTDASALAGGIWEALLTTAAGMAVAIPAGIALSWFDGIADRLAHDFEDIAARLFAAAPIAEAG